MTAGPVLRTAGLAAAAMALLAISGAPRPGPTGMARCQAGGRPAELAAVRIGPADTAASLEAKAVGVRPSERQLRWQALEFQAFVHFGMNTFTDREWGEGTEDPTLFDPSDFDAGQWVEAVQAAGIRGLIVTAKHHDGFCLWPSELTDHSVKASPWKDGKGDVVGEVAAACKKGGLAFGVYLSPWDRHEPSYGDSPKYNAHFKAQLRELLTNYGEVSEVWFDGACGEGPSGKRQVYDWAGYFALIRELQPNAVISIMGPDARWIGNETGVTRESEWSVIPVVGDDDAPSEKNPGGIAGLDAQAKDLGSMERIAEVAKRGGRLIWYPGQVDVSIRPGWFYHAAEDDKVKSLDQLLDIFYTSVGGNAQLLLNIPPDKRGRIHENDARRLRELGDRIKATFAVNLAEGAAMDAWDTAGALVDAIDVKTGRSFGYVEGFTPVFEYRLGGRKRFNVAVLKEDLHIGQVVESFFLEAWNGRGWEEIARGTTVGWKKLLRFPSVRASQVRVRVTGVRSPAFRGFDLPGSFGLYFDPGR